MIESPRDRLSPWGLDFIFPAVFPRGVVDNVLETDFTWLPKLGDVDRASTPLGVVTAKAPSLLKLLSGGRIMSSRCRGPREGDRDHDTAEEGEISGSEVS